ncbi:MAG: alpha-glucosidase [Anaerolineaceae bacterium]|jgi:alpha-glucosidase|nr:alpha-glucosidase [Anaerolineaceae bacterium]MDD4043171.1 alpha-glucosidase [Anaerolineaceae bacterium]MDD4578431.1 alpha-glucosidase [Anaerolineaceae bacterium]
MTDNKLWWKNGIIYQIYPRSFQDTNGDGIGDLAGIIQHLDYLQDLGVDGIWLSPINPSPDVDFGYDVADYHTIDPKFGNLQDFDRLLQEAHKRDLHIIMDLVLSHTSDQHRWFQESKKSVNNPYHDWYVWHDPAPKGGVPNNWLSIWGGSAWEYDENLGQYYYHMFSKHQPDLNWHNPDVRSTMLDVFRYWLDKGVDGFRLDVFNNYFQDAQFRDNPLKPGFSLDKVLGKFDAYEHIYDTSQPEMIGVVEDIRRIMNSYPERYVVGETFLVDSATARTFIGPNGLHAGFDYAFCNSPLSARAFGKAIQYWDALHGEDAWPNYFFNNHDTPRSTTRFAKGDNDAIPKLLLAMQLTVRGTPYLYYGEEIGMRDIKLHRSQTLDPFHQGRDGCRSPMQWNSRLNAGFSSGKPWLPVNQDYIVRNVESQAASTASLLAFYKELIQLRREHPALNAGKLEMTEAGNDDILVYQRQADEEKMLIVLNFSKQIVSYQLPTDGFNKWELLYAGNEALITQMVENELHLPAYGFGILISRSE